MSGTSVFPSSSVGTYHPPQIGQEASDGEEFMPRARNNENRGYQKSWRFRYGAYCYRVPKGQEHLWNGKKEFLLGTADPNTHA
jgi:hypothetical protein